jgi:ketosteroid isomerase-like protein
MPLSSHVDRDSEWEAEIIALEEEASRAFVERDLERLDRLFSDQLVVNSPINRVNDKQKILELLGARIIGHVFCRLKHELVRRDGDLVIVMGSDVVQNGPTDPTLLRRVTNVWRREQQGWRLYIRHATIVGEVPADQQS